MSIKITEEQLKQVQDEIRDFVSGLGVEAEAVTSFNQETETIDVQLESPEAAVLIGFHGETLQALQLILSFLAHRILDQWVRLNLNVGDYRQKREEQLKKLALNLAMKAKFSGETQTVANLNAAERRIVHLTLVDHPDVLSQSEGEGRQRILTIKPKTS